MTHCSPSIAKHGYELRLFILTFSLIIVFSTGFAQGTKMHKPRHGPDLSFLADSNVLTRSDYLNHLEKVFEITNKVPVTITSFTKLSPIERHLKQDEQVLALLKGRLNQSDRTLNLQNLQMFQTLLGQLENNNQDCLQDLQEYEKELRELKSEIYNLHKDTVLTMVFSRDSLRAIFREQLGELRKKRIKTDSLIKDASFRINNLEARTSANLIGIKELMYTTESELTSVGIKAFGKERRYLWETANRPTANKSINFKKFIKSEQLLSQYYFIYTRSSRVLLLLTGVLFFIWVFVNFNSIAKHNRLANVADFNFQLISPRPWLITLILIFSMAPVYDLRAPALYIEFIHLLQAVCLTFLFFRKLPRPLFYRWCILVIFIIAPAVLRMLGMPPRFQRWMLFFLSVFASGFGLIMLKSLGGKAAKFKIIWGVGLIYAFFAAISILCNLAGRVTLAQVFYNTGTSALLNAISLTIIVQMMIEAFLLQMASSRARKNNSHYFDWQPATKGVGRVAAFVAILMWFILFTTNLNIFNNLYEQLTNVLNEKRTVGSISFTLGGIILFLGIIWLANFLQKYITYFFGDTGDDLLDENINERSKLLVTRLVLLIGGFLLAVAASGLPIDKITVILGALGVGIGLGLQNIVSNFVSGIILIFDKTIRIGDVVELGDKKGRVKEIGVRASTLLSDEGAEIIIPNGAILSNNIINWTLSNNYMRLHMEFTISRPFNSDDIVSVIREAVISNSNVYTNKEPKVLFSPVNTNSQKVKIYFWCKDISQAENTRSTIHAHIFEKLEKMGVTIL